MDAVTRYTILDADSTGCCKIEITTTLSTDDAAEFERCARFLSSTVGDALFTKSTKLPQKKKAPKTLLENVAEWNKAIEKNGYVN